MNKVLKAHLALLIVNIIYGANYSVVKEVVPSHIQSFALVVLRAASAVILFWLSSIFLPKQKIAKKDFITLILLGVFGVALNQLLFIRGLELSTPINASIIMIFNPIIVMLLEIVFLKEEAPLTRILGIALGAAGATLLLLFREGISFKGSDTLTGDIMILINCISWAIFIVMVKPLMLKYHSVTVTKWVFTFGLFYVLPFGWTQFHAFDIHSLGFGAWLCIVYVLIASTFIAYLFNNYALAELSPSVASTYVYLQPIIAAGIAVWLGQDKINLVKVLSAILIVGGIYLVAHSRKKSKKNARLAEAQTKMP
jgi:drug/metabolite transporter (DMT)-like permease